MTTVIKLNLHTAHTGRLRRLWNTLPTRGTTASLDFLARHRFEKVAVTPRGFKLEAPRPGNVTAFAPSRHYSRMLIGVGIESLRLDADSTPANVLELLNILTRNGLPHAAELARIVHPSVRFEVIGSSSDAHSLFRVADKGLKLDILRAGLVHDDLLHLIYDDKKEDVEIRARAFLNAYDFIDDKRAVILSFDPPLQTSVARLAAEVELLEILYSIELPHIQASLKENMTVKATIEHVKTVSLDNDRDYILGMTRSPFLWMRETLAGRAETLSGDIQRILAKDAEESVRKLIAEKSKNQQVLIEMKDTEESTEVRIVLALNIYMPNEQLDDLIRSEERRVSIAALQNPKVQYLINLARDEREPKALTRLAASPLKVVRDEVGMNPNTSQTIRDLLAANALWGQ